MKIDVKALAGTAFQKKVWSEITNIKKGRVITYKELAQKIGRPRAVRAVANAVGANPCPARLNSRSGGAPMIPCHRVVRSDGTLGGYSGKGGVKTKRKLLLQEKASLGGLTSKWLD